MSSGRRAISSSGGNTPMANVYNPNEAQLTRQPQPTMMNWATSGIIARPVPCPMLSKEKAKRRRRTNQLLMVTDVPNSNGHAKTARPGT